MVKEIFLVLAVFCCSSCIKTTHISGHALDSEQINKLQKVKSKADIQTLIGTPTSISDFGQETWYYISSTKESVGFLKDKIIKQDVFEISFNKNGVVNKITRYNEKDANKPVIVKEYTPASGTNTSPVQHFLGNIGKYRDTKAEEPTFPRTGF